MADLASTDVTVAVVRKERVGRGFINSVTITFGDGALTYPSGGVPLPALTNFGLRSACWRMPMDKSADGYIYKYDVTNHKIRIYQSGTGSHTHNMTFIGGITATEPVAIDGGDTLGKNAATNRTILGADVATKGGVVAGTLTAAPLVELGSVAVAATVLTAMAFGR